MPDSHFTFDGLSGSGDYDTIKDIVEGFLAGLATGGVSVVGYTFQQIVDPVPVPEPPTTEDDGPGNDVECTAPDFTPEDQVTYTIGWTDNTYDFHDTLYEISPNQTLGLANAYNAGRQFTILAKGLNSGVLVPGALSTPLS